MKAKGTLASTILRGKVEGKRSGESPARRWLDDVKEWTELKLNEMWREPEDHVAWRKHVSRVALTDLIVYGIQDSFDLKLINTLWLSDNPMMWLGLVSLIRHHFHCHSFSLLHLSNFPSLPL